MIRKATLADKESITKIWRKDSAFLGAIYMGALKERIEKQMVHIYEQDGQIIGFLEYRKRRDGVSVIYHICVLAEYRKQGIGKALINSLSLPMRLKVTGDNENAIRFYEHFGFNRISSDFANTGRPLFVYEKQS